jgi:serine/threonine-protein kinase
MVDPESPSLKLVGAVLNGRWKLVRLLGEGGMGAVYEGDSVRGEGRCAIKILHPEFTGEPQVLARFFAEAQASQSLQHPNIARVFETARAEDGTPYLVMELLQGLPLSAYLAGPEPMPMEQAAPIIHEVLQALTLAHARRIVHRDLKPENIFLSRDARGGFVAKVLDFGIAKVMDAAGGMQHKTRTGALLGTPGYMSPEQIKSSKSVDTRSDLWSVGAMFYELVTGREIFPAENDYARLTRVLTDEVPPVEQANPKLASWGQFFRRALAKDPAQRFQTAEEMDQSLMMLARGGPSAPEWSVAPTPRAAQAAPSPAGAPASAPATSPTGGQAPANAHAHTVPVQIPPGGFAPSPSPPSQTSPSPYSQPSPLPLPHLGPSPHPATPSVAVVSPPPLHPHSPVKPPGVPGPSVPIAVMSPSPPLAPLAGAPGTAVSTHVSAERPAGAPAFHGAVSPPVQVIDAPPMHKGAPWWVVGVAGAVGLVVGFVLGFLVG